MKLTFTGTWGNTGQNNARHRRHRSLLVSYRNRQVMVDCGKDWLDKVFDINPHAIILTHAHPDYARDLKNGAPCRVYAPAETLDQRGDYPVVDFSVIFREDIAVKDFLKKYRETRAFDKTAEPVGGKSKKSLKKNIFVSQMHDASNLHYDSRIEVDGDLAKVMSWYDNEWGCASQMIREAVAIFKK